MREWQLEKSSEMPSMTLLRGGNSVLLTVPGRDSRINV